MKHNKLFFTIFLSCFLSIFMVTESKAQYNEIAKILASDADVGDAFGASVSISGDRAIVGARLNDDNGNFSGSAYIFERNESGRWTETQKLTASDADEGEQFGVYVSISGDRAIVGAIGNDASGSAYIFERNESGEWTEIQKLIASDAASNDAFGSSVSISGDCAIVGALGNDDDGSGSGSAYIFERNESGGWTETEKLTASDAAEGDFFGGSVSISGDRVIVAASFDDDGGLNSGSAYIFERDGDGENETWTQKAKLTASDADAFDQFGRSVSISGDRAIVGVSSDDDDGESSGSAYIFEKIESGEWTQKQKLNSSDPDAIDQFGRSVSISGDRAIVGAIGNDASGSAYIFERDESGEWTETQKLNASDADAGYSFGRSVSISGDRAIVGARLNSNLDNGAAYIFEKNQSVQDLLSNLITSVDGSGIHKGTKRLLTGFLNSADKSLARGRERIAILKLVAFKWLVKVQSPRKIDATLADEWIGKAEEIIDAIKTALPKSSEADELASEDVLPETYNLNQNYPNPFNPTTTISYSIPENEYVTLSIYDALGKEVAVLDNGFRTAGNYSHTFDASNLSSGMYFYTIRSGNFVQTKKMLLMK